MSAAEVHQYINSAPPPRVSVSAAEYTARSGPSGDGCISSLSAAQTPARVHAYTPKKPGLCSFIELTLACQPDKTIWLDNYRTVQSREMDSRDCPKVNPIPPRIKEVDVRKLTPSPAGLHPIFLLGELARQRMSKSRTSI